MSRRSIVIAALGTAALAAGGGAALALVAEDHAAAGSKPSFAHLLGASEAPGPGDADGRGAATVQVVGPAKVCVTLIVNGMATPNQAHIHRGARGVAGPVVVPLKAPRTGTAGTSAGCFTAPRSVVSQIAGSPGAFYVNVHNGQHPAGALRGQLAAAR